MPSQSQSFIKNHFGSKKGLARSVKHQVLYSLGYYRSLSMINVDSIHRLVFVCSGNICRSPLAEVVAKNQGFPSISYGLHCRGGDPADSRAQRFATRIGLTLEQHVTQNIRDYVALPGDLLVGMEPKHEHSLKALFGTTRKVTLCGLWLPRSRPYLHDPYNTNDTFFFRCEELVAQSTELLVNRIAGAHA